MEFKTKEQLASMTNAEKLAFLKEFNDYQKLIKEERKAGNLPKSEKAKQEKTAEFLLIAGQFKATIDANLEAIKGFFEKSKTTEKPTGQIGIQFRVKDEMFYVQVISEEARKAKAPKKVGEAKPEEAKSEEAKTE